MRHYYSPFLVVVFHILQIAFGIFLDKNRLLKCNGLIKGLFKHILLKEEVKWNNAPYYFLELITRTMIHYETILLPTNIILGNYLLFMRYRSLPFLIYQDDIWLTLNKTFTLSNFILLFSLLTVSFFRNCIDFHILMIIKEFNITIVK